MNKRIGRVALAVAAAFAVSGAAHAVIINNDIAVGTVGSWQVDVTAGGESRTGNLTAVGTPSGTLFNTEVIFDYFSYVDVGPLGGAVQLSATTITSPVASAGDDQATSAGSFTGAGGNTINWSVLSAIADGSSTMTSTFTFSSATGGALGAFRFYQYLDEDVLGAGDDVFFTRGSTAGGDLELFTVDNNQAIGVSHSGALSAAQGLSNATFAGWAACTFDTMRPAITNGTQLVSTTGVICTDLATDPELHPVVGASFGPRDIVSVLAWDVNAQASSATIVTTLGGIAQASQIPTDVPAPGSLALLGLGFAALGLARRRRSR